MSPHHPPITISDVEVIDASPRFSLIEICARCGVDQTLIIAMVSYGIVEPHNDYHIPEQWRFMAGDLIRLQKALRLKRDLSLNLSGLAFALDLLDEVNSLRQDINQLQHYIKTMQQD
ncbi:chaperone modulator CbpM [Zooshikella ganghwensis]|uniref:chaperone modulator CbpM n=1 Tax=Zooshikella ganghwensis TaxID=202772 RepID=UPI0004221675|nr:chaperone modulator CbpM [Zooshikella ganghwensis]